MKDRVAPVLAIALVGACIVVAFIGGGGDFSKMGFLTMGPENAIGGASIRAAANNAGGGTTMGSTDEGGSGASVSTNGSSTLSPTLNRIEPSGETLALIESTFSNNSSAPSKAASVGNNTGRGINSGGTGQASGDGAGSSGASLGSGGGSTATSAASGVKGRPTLSVTSTLPSGPATGTQPGSRNTGDGEGPGNAANSSEPMAIGRNGGTTSGGEGAPGSNGALASGASAPGLSVGSGGSVIAAAESRPTGGTLLAPDAVIVWQGGNGGQSNNWNHPQNWVGNTQPTINDTAQFDNTANSSNLAPSIGATNTSVGAILFAAGTTNSYNITGTATLTLGSAAANGITDASATDQTISVSNITEAVNQTWSVTGAGNLSISSNVATGPLTLTLDGSSTGTGTISGIISGTSSTTIVKNGTGTWILSGAETYVGATMVNAGTLLFDGTTPAGGGDFTVNSGGTLGGTGVIGGTTSNTPRVIVNAGGNLAPGDGGNTTGILTSNSLRLMPGSNFLVDINGTVVGTGYDQYRITASGASSGVAQFAGSNLVVNVGAATLTPGDTFTILIRTNPSGNITLSDTFAGLPNSTLFTATNGWIFRINYNVQPRGGTLF